MHLRRCLLFQVVSIFFITLVLTSFIFSSLLLFAQYYDWSLVFRPVLSSFLIVRFIEWCGLIDIVFALVSVSIRLAQFIHDGINFHCFCLTGLLLLELLGPLHVNVVVDAGS